jgi:hypothetical protein
MQESRLVMVTGCVPAELLVYVAVHQECLQLAIVHCRDCDCIGAVFQVRVSAQYMGSLGTGFSL